MKERHYQVKIFKEFQPQLNVRRKTQNPNYVLQITNGQGYSRELLKSDLIRKLAKSFAKIAFVGDMEEYNVDLISYHMDYSLPKNSPGNCEPINENDYAHFSSWLGRETSDLEFNFDRLNNLSVISLQRRNDLAHRANSHYFHRRNQR